MTTNYKKRIRLKTFDYKGCYRYFITICAFNKEEKFLDAELNLWLLDVLKEKSKTFGFKVWAYCFMPEHLHLLIEGEDASSDMSKFISSYKQTASFYHKKKTGEPLWQINFYEHVLRDEEDTFAAARYIFNNPVRKGLANDIKDYRFIGSFEFDVLKMQI